MRLTYINFSVYDSDYVLTKVMNKFGELGIRVIMRIDD